MNSGCAHFSPRVHDVDFPFAVHASRPCLLGSPEVPGDSGGEEDRVACCREEGQPAGALPLERGPDGTAAPGKSLNHLYIVQCADLVPNAHRLRPRLGNASVQYSSREDA